MVYFSCSACNESLKKAKVAKHLTFCRRCPSLVCLDCQQEFSTESYTQHNQCITEVEKYSGPGYVLPSNANKGQKKQLGWMESVRCSIEAFLKETESSKNKKNEQILMTGLLRYDNIPRKKTKFVNFVKSSFTQFRYKDSIINSAWDIISVPQVENDDSKNEVKPESQSDPKSKAPETTATVVTSDYSKVKSKKKSKKSKERPDNDDDVDDVKASKRFKANHSNEQLDDEHDEHEDDIQQKKKKKKKKKKSEESSAEETENVVSTLNGKAKDKKSKKRRHEEDVGNESEETEEIPSTKRSKKDYAPPDFERQPLNTSNDATLSPRKFIVKDVVREIVERKGEKGVPLKKLEKMVVNEYLSNLSEGQLVRPHKISSKLKTIIAKHFRLIHDRVFLRHDE